MGNKKFSSKMLISSLCVLAIIATVVGCQVYDSQTNSVLYSAMNGLGEGAVSWETYSADFNKQMQKFKDTSDTKAYDYVIDGCLAYEKFYNSALSLVTSVNTKAAETDKIDLHNVDAVKKKFKEKVYDEARLTNDLADYTTKDYENFKFELDPTNDVEYTLAGLYQQKYQLKWDWNSKKGR